MSGFEINQAARMMRAGNEFSETNKKLRDAVYKFIEWLFEVVEEYQLPPANEFGWSFKKLNDKQIQLSFQTPTHCWLSVTTNKNENVMWHVVECCRTLAGPGGEKLIAWLEQQTQERNQLYISLQSAIKNFRSSLNAGTVNL